MSDPVILSNSIVRKRGELIGRSYVIWFLYVRLILDLTARLGDLKALSFSRKRNLASMSGLRRLNCVYKIC